MGSCVLKGENRPSAPNVAPDTPEYRTYEQTDALGEDEEGSFEPGELEYDRVDDQAGYALQSGLMSHIYDPFCQPRLLTGQALSLSE